MHLKGKLSNLIVVKIVKWSEKICRYDTASWQVVVQGMPCM